MIIYAGNPDGESCAKAKNLGMGVCVATGDKPRTSKAWRDMPCILDNGAFRCWQRGYPFSSDRFYAQMRSCFCSGLDLEFIVCPDIVAGGRRSLDFSMSWILPGGGLQTAPRVALAVQDGMTPDDLMAGGIWNAPNITHLFVGGTLEWKWRTANDWVVLAHEKGRLCHIGRCGTLEGLERAAEIGADSVDSTSFARNGSFHIVEKFLRQDQLLLWPDNKEVFE
jgi:hypothetical protein